jgi:hypothetical protein
LRPRDHLWTIKEDAAESRSAGQDGAAQRAIAATDIDHQVKRREGVRPDHCVAHLDGGAAHRYVEERTRPRMVRPVGAHPDPKDLEVDGWPSCDTLTERSKATPLRLPTVILRQPVQRLGMIRAEEALSRRGQGVQARLP